MISVITITYNNFEELESTLNSIKDLDRIEIVVINGGNCEKTAKLLSSWPLQKNFQYQSEPDKGIADAFNKGLKLAKGDKIVFLNSGDLLLDKNYFRSAEDLLDSSDDISFMHGKVIFTDILCGPMVMSPRLCSLGRGMPYYHQTMCVKKEVFDKVGGFDISFKVAMDYDFVVRMKKARFEGYYYTRNPVVQMDGGGISATNETLSILECYRSLRKHTMLNGQNLYGILLRYFLYLTRRFMLKVGLKN